MALLRSNALSLLFSVCLVTAVFYLGKPFLMPLALSILLAFLLAPLAARLENSGCGRVLSVVLVTVFAFSILATALYIVGAQAIDLAKSLPKYHENLEHKVFTPLSKLISAFSAYARGVHSAAPPGLANEPVPVDLATSNVNLLAVAKDLAGPLLSPLGTAAMVVVYVIFFLFDRQNLRDRFIHLVGHGRLHLTTQAIDDATDRVSRYLAAQLIVNASYGIPVGIGLYFIGIPNAPLWGLLAIVLRFLPYLGVCIAASFPIVLSFAISPGWAQPVETIVLFLGVELVTGNVVEPWLYGASTGLAPSAIVVAAVFWTWVWGAGGLLLATPLTVCLVVLGKHMSSLSFLHVLLGDHPPIAPENRFYQRLLAEDRDEVDDMIEDYRHRDAIPELFDNVILPAMQLAEHDRMAGDLTKEEQKTMFEHLQGALEQLEGFHPPDEADMHPVVIAAARTEADAVAGAMLAYLLRKKGIVCTWFSERILNSEVASRVSQQPDTILCVSTLTQSGVRGANSIFRRVEETLNGPKFLGLWHGERGDVTGQSSPGIETVTSLAEAIRLISSSASSKIEPPLPASAAPSANPAS